MQQSLSIKERTNAGEIEQEQLKESVMHERQAINTTSGSSSMKPKSFSVTLTSSVEDVHVVTLPVLISAADETNTYKLDVWSRLNGFPEFEDIQQIEPRLVESRLSIIDRQDRLLKAQLDKINHDRKSMKTDVRKYEDLVEYLGKCEYGDNINVVSKSDTLTDVEFLLDEKAAQKEDLDEFLEKIYALKSQVEYRMKKLEQGITQLKTRYDKHELQGEDDEAKVCLRNLLMKIGPFGHAGTSFGGSKIPMLVSADKFKSLKIGPFVHAGTSFGGSKIPIVVSSDKFKSLKIGPFVHAGTSFGGSKIPMLVSADKFKSLKIGPFVHAGTSFGGSKIPMLVSASKTMSFGNDGIKQMNIQTKSVSERHNVRANTDEKIKYTPTRNVKNNNSPSQNINRRYKDIKSMLNTGRKCVEREVGKASLEQSIASSKIAAKNKQVEDDVHQRDVFKQDEGGKGRDSTKEKRRKVIKCKIDTGRNNAVRQKADKDMKSKVTAHVNVGNKQANTSDMKTRNEGKSSFSNKPLLPQIKSVTQKKAIPKTKFGSKKINDNNKLTPLPKIRGREHDTKDLINPPAMRNRSLIPLPINPLPPIKSVRRDNDNTKNGTKDDNRNAGVMRISFAPSPPPRAQPSPPHILDGAERTQHRA